METKELKIQVPEGYEIDREKSTFECIKFKLIKKDITYEEVCKNIFSKDKVGFFIANNGVIDGGVIDYYAADKNNATNSKQLKRILALNQLLNIAEYYNRLHPQQSGNLYCISFEDECTYLSGPYYKEHSVPSIVATFNRMKDAQAVIDNPDFREILDTIYK